MPLKCGDLVKARNVIIIILTPLVLLPLPLVYYTKAGRCAYGILLMAVFWITEALPLPVTALLPVALFPWLGVASSRDLCTNYLKDTNMLFMGGLMVALAIEKWNLHRRIALRVLIIVGSRPQWLLFGLMVTTAFLSMWISNTATTAMMAPIAQAVLDQLELRQGEHGEQGMVEEEEEEGSRAEQTIEKNEHRKVKCVPNEGCTTFEEIDIETTPITSKIPYMNNLRRCILLSVCYAANIGGISTLIGTPPNMVIKGQLDTLYGSSAGITFSSWFLFACPLSVMCLVVAWLWLVLIFLGPRMLKSTFKRRASDVHESGTNELIRKEYEKLGPMSFAEKAVLGHFIILVVLWFTREPGFVVGWSSLLPDGYVTDAPVAITVAVILFVFPSNLPGVFSRQRVQNSKDLRGLLTWSSMKHFSWDIIIVIGGAFALAEACQTSGLSEVIGQLFRTFDGVPVWLLVLGLCAITSVFTELTSNAALTSIVLPILAELANTLEVHPLYLLLPVTVSASFAFMLPIATAPNAIVFAYGHLRTIDMVKAGAVLNILCVLILQLAINTWGFVYFRLGEFPAWAGNATAFTVDNKTVLTNDITVQNQTIT